MCGSVYCGNGRECAIQDGSTVCVCVRTCPEHYRPICGSDGVTYINHCQMHRTACMLGLAIRKHSNGTCPILPGEQSEFPGMTRPLVCYEAERNILRLAIIEWMRDRLKKDANPDWNYKDIMADVFFTCDLSTDAQLGTDEFLHCLRQNNTHVNGLFGKEDASLRGLCMDALVVLLDTNKDWSLSLDEFRHGFHPEYKPPSKQCFSGNQIYGDGAETKVGCNLCVCACGNWVCTAAPCITEVAETDEKSSLPSELPTQTVTKPPTSPVINFESSLVQQQQQPDESGRHDDKDAGNDANTSQDDTSDEFQFITIDDEHQDEKQEVDSDENRDDVSGKVVKYNEKDADIDGSGYGLYDDEDAEKDEDDDGDDDGYHIIRQKYHPADEVINDDVTKVPSTSSPPPSTPSTTQASTDGADKPSDEHKDAAKEMREVLRTPLTSLHLLPDDDYDDDYPGMTSQHIDFAEFGPFAGFELEGPDMRDSDDLLLEPLMPKPQKPKRNKATIIEESDVLTPQEAAIVEPASRVAMTDLLHDVTNKMAAPEDPASIEPSPFDMWSWEYDYDYSEDEKEIREEEQEEDPSQLGQDLRFNAHLLGTDGVVSDNELTSTKVTSSKVTPSGQPRFHTNSSEGHLRQNDDHPTLNGPVGHMVNITDLSEGNDVPTDGGDGEHPRKLKFLVIDNAALMKKAAEIEKSEHRSKASTSENTPEKKSDTMNDVKTHRGHAKGHRSHRRHSGRHGDAAHENSHHSPVDGDRDDANSHQMSAAYKVSIVITNEQTGHSQREEIDIGPDGARMTDKS